MRIASLVLGAIALAASAATVRAADPNSTEATPIAEAPAPAPAPRGHAVTLGPTATGSDGREGRIHTVVAGDTLWDISEAYLGTPWVWPSIWKENPEVRDPHRIYPGDRLWIQPDGMRRLSDAEADSLLGQLPASVGDAAPAPLGTVNVSFVDAIGFVSADILAAAGSVVAGARESLLYAQGMPVLISLGEGQVQVGDRFTVVRANEEVVDPETDRDMGVFVDRLGWLEVTRVDVEASEAIVRGSRDGIRAGDRILPREEPRSEIALQPTAVPVEGQIAFFPSERVITGQQDVVFLNRGSDHGLASGSTLEVYRPRGEAMDEETGTPRLLPDEVVADLVVVSAEPTTAVALVTRSRVDVGRGDYFRNAPLR